MTNDQAEQIIAVLNQIAALLAEIQKTMNANPNRLEVAIHHASDQIINRG
jgi:hypothetical protein